MMSKQSQKGGDGSNNFQSENMVVQVGIDEKRAREIYKEMILQVKEEFTAEAYEIAKKRVMEFENKLMPKMQGVEGALQAFSDPSFQLLLVEAQKTAASTERTADYDLLSELLVHRFKTGQNRNTRVGINRAVEIIDEISDEALLGLSVIHATNSFVPATGDVFKGLDTLESLFSKIIYDDLPRDNEWLEHLEILNAVRLNQLGSLKKIDEYYCEILAGYIDNGIPKESQGFEKAKSMLLDNNLSENLLIEHDLNSDYVRIPVPNKKHIPELSLIEYTNIGRAIKSNTIALNKEQVDVIKRIYSLYEHNVSVRDENKRLFKKEWNQRPHLKILADWWNSINGAPQITAVGRVLAHCNVQRCDENLPPLN